MNTQHTPGPWYSARNASPSQGLVIAETTGANIAVTYDPRDANIISAAPEMIHALELAQHELNQMGCECSCEELPIQCAVCAVNMAVAKAKGAA